jgi:hypothetical protein
MSALKRLDVAENERGVRVRQSDCARRQRLGRPFVSAEDFRTREFADAVEARNATPHRGARRRLRGVTTVEAAHVPDGVDDCSIAGAAAYHTGERVLDCLLARPGIPSP